MKKKRGRYEDGRNQKRKMKPKIKTKEKEFVICAKSKKISVRTNEFYSKVA